MGTLYDCYYVDKLLPQWPFSGNFSHYHPAFYNKIPPNRINQPTTNGLYIYIFMAGMEVAGCIDLFSCLGGYMLDEIVWNCQNSVLCMTSIGVDVCIY